MPPHLPHNKRRNRLNRPDQVVDQFVVRENLLLQFLETVTPVAETYIQDLVPDNDFGTVPSLDHYFLGKVDLSHGLTQTSYLPKHAETAGHTDLLSRFFGIHYLPRGFAQMMLIDGGGFDRDHYDFAFVRREFLGDVRTLVFSVSPRNGAGHGRFVGNIWVEDKGYNITCASTGRTIHRRRRRCICISIAGG